MKYIVVCLSICAFLLTGCGAPDPMVEVNQLVEQGKIVPAKMKFKELVAQAQNPNVEREYIKFLFQHNQYQDFINITPDYLRRYPEDVEIKELNYDYYAMLAGNAERQGHYETALEYIVLKLLHQDYKDFRKWESKQTSVLKKWFNEAKEKGDQKAMKESVTKMFALGFENLARSMSPELYEEVKSQLEEDDKSQQAQENPAEEGASGE